MIQAFYSPEVPREYVETKTDLLGYLREYAARSGGKIQLNLTPTEIYSTAAREAEKRFGIEPKRVITTDAAKQSSAEIFLGVAFTSGLEEVVIPFFDRGLPVEYELTRSIQVVSRSNRKKVGILSTDAKMMGGFDQMSFGQSPEWSIVTELKKQYEVTSVSPDTPIADDFGALLVAQPSSLTQKQIDNLTAYVKKGGPALLFLDPFPVDNPQIAPEVPQVAGRRPVRRQPSPRAQGRPQAAARPGGDRLADHRDRLERVQPPSRSSPTCPPRSCSSAGAAARRTRSTRTRSRPRAFRRSSPCSPAWCGARGAAPAPSSPPCCGPATRGA